MTAGSDTDKALDVDVEEIRRARGFAPYPNYYGGGGLAAVYNIQQISTRQELLACRAYAVIAYLNERQILATTELVAALCRRGPRTIKPILNIVAWFGKPKRWKGPPFWFGPEACLQTKEMPLSLLYAPVADGVVSLWNTLAGRAHWDGICDDIMSDLARWSLISTGQLRLYRAELARLGYVEVRTRPGKTCVYRMLS